MNSARTSGVVALILLTGVAIWGGTFHFLENGTNTAGESLSPADRNEQVLLDGLADGRILYFKIEDYRMDRIIPGASDPPHRVIIENWWQPDTGGSGRTERGDGARPGRQVASIYASNRWKIYDHVRVQRRDDGNERPVGFSGRVDRLDLEFAAEPGIQP